jgi:WxL domain surface cell wall-binding
MLMRRLARALGVLVVLAGGLTAGSVALLPGTAMAGPCGTAIAAGTSCAMTGTVSLSAGPLTLTSPSSLSWSSTLTGLDQSLVDTNAGDQQYTVNDATGSGAGWHVTAAATTFTNGTATFPNTGTFVTNGSVTSVTSTSAPSATCTGTCTLPTNSTTYPVGITTAAASPTPVTIYDTAAGTGMGQVVIGGSTAPDPVGWWVNVPASATAGSYTSTITMEIISAP